MDKEPLPKGWEELKAFMQQPDVSVPYKNLLQIIIPIWEHGYRREIPPDWLPLAELLKIRKLPDYERIIKAEERIGKYARSKVVHEPPEKKRKTHAPTANIHTLWSSGGPPPPPPPSFKKPPKQEINVQAYK
jgi:hypothetical protein